MSMGDDLLAIIKDERQIQIDLRQQPLVDCPVCGETLQVNSRGTKDCPLGHFTAPAGATRGQYGT